MYTLARIRSGLRIIYLLSACIGLFMSPSIAAAGSSIRYNNQYHGLSIGHNQNRTVPGNINPRQHSYRSYASRYQHNYNNRDFRHYSYPRYSVYSSPARRYYNRHATSVYFDSRFPNSYRSRSYTYLQPTQPRSYRSYYNNPVNAWETLAQGQAQIALQQFGNEAQSYPKAGIPKMGYALSSAASGDLKQGVVAMRRAFKIDPEALHHYQLDQSLHVLLNELINRYQYSLNHRGRHKDEAFMVAALSYLNGNYTSAHNALKRAKRDGDRSRSMRNLKAFLDEKKISSTTNY